MEEAAEKSCIVIVRTVRFRVFRSFDYHYLFNYSFVWSSTTASGTEDRVSGTIFFLQG